MCTVFLHKTLFSIFSSILRKKKAIKSELHNKKYENRIDPFVLYTIDVTKENNSDPSVPTKEENWDLIEQSLFFSKEIEM